MTLVIAVDGPSGSGKSSAAKGVARALGFRYLDTGAMYRAMTWWMLREGVAVLDAEAVAARAAEPLLEPGTDPDAPTISVDGVDVSGPIRTREVTNAVSAVSSVPIVRERLVLLQREIIAAGDIVAEGRDIGTVVVPDAAVKIFLTASEEVRAQRRVKELAADPAATVEVTRTEQARRDLLDSTRKTSPLIKADDAHEIDSTELGLYEVIEAILRLAKEQT
ncbi:(d)CMP kinase [Actinomadura sp. HBU206391]|uniref:(d)CMP kinase n=1 Tax=Actinomadura sp. HBU206391 TaxID=2731692 RepID=UPI0016504399|nr:(d)CMP kinase [Actinomadura sp. HBU206391]MBC6463789.1 (d)CMP kinase [Actinomadura sp. HBU206391]